MMLCESLNTFGEKEALHLCRALGEVVVRIPPTYKWVRPLVIASPTKSSPVVHGLEELRLMLCMQGSFRWKNKEEEDSSFMLARLKEPVVLR